MPTLIDKLDAILGWHDRLGSRVPALLQPGLTRQRIMELERRLPFKLSEETIALYQWRNGIPLATASNDNLFLFEMHQFLPLEDALAVFRETYPIIKEFYELTDWLPVFQDVAGDGYGAIGTAQRQASAPIVLLFEGDGVRVVFDSLEKLIDTMLACFEQGVFSIGDDRWLDTDFRALGHVARQVNPASRYWQNYR